jgi:hypothetical protein
MSISPKAQHSFLTRCATDRWRLVSQRRVMSSVGDIILKFAYFSASLFSFSSHDFDLRALGKLSSLEATTHQRNDSNTSPHSPESPTSTISTVSPSQCRPYAMTPSCRNCDLAEFRSSPLSTITSIKRPNQRPPPLSPTDSVIPQAQYKRGPAAEPSCNCPLRKHPPFRSVPP